MSMSRSAAAAALLIALAAGTSPATAASNAPGATPPQAGAAAAKTQDVPGRAQALAFLDKIAAGDTTSAYQMLTQPRRQRMARPRFDQEVAPLAAAGITDFRIQSTKTSTSTLGYDGDFGFYMNLRKLTLAGPLLTQRGQTVLTMTLVASGESWQVHEFRFAPLAVGSR